ncbi:MAG: ribonuclease J, partial [Patescibacteria group bacterium]
THGHLDHIGGIPYIVDKIGNPPIYTSLLTAVMIKKRQEEFPHLPTLNINVTKSGEPLKIGQIRCRFFAISHTVPDSMGVIIETPYGNLVFTGDIRIENENGIPVDYEVKTWGDIGKEKNLLLVADSTNVERLGFSYPEKLVQANVKEIIRHVKGRVIIGTFASLLERIIYIILAAEDLGKKVAIEGRSMKTNIEIAKELGLLKVKAGTLISSDDLQNYPEDKIVIMATGAQGDEFAALMRMAQKEHKYVKIKKGDTILLSSSVIPGNEKSVQKLKDNLSRQGAKIDHYGIANVHSSGHSYQGELEWIHKMVKPKFFIPVHGHHSMLRVHADLAEKLGLPEKNIVVPDNGTIIEITEAGTKIGAIKAKADSKVVMVDGLGSNNVQEVVIRDRQMLAQDGMFVIIAIVDVKTGKIRKSPDIISRGFVYLKESQELLRAVRGVAKKTIEDSTAQMNPINLDYVKNNVREELGKYLFQKTHKRPIILPVIIEV